MSDQSQQSRPKRLDQFRPDNQMLVREKRFQIGDTRAIRAETRSLHQCANGSIIDDVEPPLKIPWFAGVMNDDAKESCEIE